jgi:hypothetical protein
MVTIDALLYKSGSDDFHARIDQMVSKAHHSHSPSLASDSQDVHRAILVVQRWKPLARLVEMP